MRALSREEAASLVRFGPVPNQRVWLVLVAAFVSVGLVLALAFVLDTGAVMPLAGPAVLVAAGLYFVGPLLRMQRMRFVIRNGTRIRGRVVSMRRVGSVGAVPTSPLLELTVALTTAEGQAFEGTMLMSGSRDPRLNETVVGRERWFYFHPRHPRMAVPEEEWRLTSSL